MPSVWAVANPSPNSENRPIKSRRTRQIMERDPIISEALEKAVGSSVMNLSRIGLIFYLETVT
jgi:hypothetical protein